jgi:hypothetical protein
MSVDPQVASQRITQFVNTLLRIALVVAAGFAIATGNWPTLFASLGTLVLTYVPQLLASQINIRIPLQFEVFITIFLYATLFLGEVDNFYEKFWWWDSVLHIGSAFAFGFAGFLILYLLSVQDKLRASPFLVAIFTFAFALAIGTMWEIFEFTMDSLFGTNMQKSGLRDTMGDLIVDAIGGGSASVIGYVYLKYKVRDPFDILIRVFLMENPRFRPHRPVFKRRKT